MIPKEKIEASAAQFTQNPYWKGYLDNAPESAKEYIRMVWAYSLLGEDERNDEEFKAALKETRAKLPADALKYLHDNEKNMTAKNIYKKMLDALDGGDAQNDADGNWKGVWVTDAIYAAAPELAKRYYENAGWVEFVGNDEPPAEQDGRKMTQPDIFTKMQDADWDYLIKNTHTYAHGMPLVLARKHYQGKGYDGTPIGGGDNGGGSSVAQNADLGAQANAAPVDLSPVDGYAPKTAGEMLGDLKDAPKPDDEAAEALFTSSIVDALKLGGIEANVTVKRDREDLARIVVAVEPDIGEDEADDSNGEALRTAKAIVEKCLKETWCVAAVSFRDYYLGDGVEVVVTMPNGMTQFGEFAQNMVYERAKREINAYPPSFFVDTKSHFRQLRNMAAETTRFSDANLFDLESGEAVAELPTSGYQVSFQTDASETTGDPVFLYDEEYDALVTRLMAATGAKPQFTKFGDTPKVSFLVADRDKAVAIMREFNQRDIVDWASLSADAQNADNAQNNDAQSGGGDKGDGGNADADGGQGGAGNADAK